MWPDEHECAEEEVASRMEHEACSPSSARSSVAGSSGSHYAVDADSRPWTEHTEMVQTRGGLVKVTVCGEASCPPLLTYHDVGLNHSTCFQGMLLCEETSSLLLHNFCIFHIDSPGHEAQAPGIDPEEPYLSAEDLADQVAEVAQHFRLTDVTCLGVSAGSYILSLLAIRHRHLVKGLILVSPVCRAPSWVEWARNGLLMATLSYCGMARHVKDFLLERYFCQDQHGYHGPGSDSLLSFRRELDERDPESVMRYMSAMHQRKDLTRSLADALIKAQCLVVVGALSPFLDEAEHIVKQLDPQRTHFLKVEACGSLVTEERPQAMHESLCSFFKKLLPLVSSARGYQTPSLIRSPASSPNQSSPSSGPSSPLSDFFHDNQRDYVARSPVTVSFTDLSLAPVQRRLKPIKVLDRRRGYDSDDDFQGSATPSEPAMSPLQLICAIASP